MNRSIPCALLVVAIISGCVIAPIPLFETSRRSMWDGVGDSSKKLSIVEEQRTWYLPIVVSPEGPAKMRRQKSECHYFFGLEVSREKQEWRNLDDLPWLTIEDDANFYTWHKIARLEGSAYWVAFRRVSHDGTSTRGGTFEIAVFDRRALASKQVVASRRWPAVQSSDEEYLSYLGYDPKSQSIILDSSIGPKRISLLTGSKKEPNQAPEPTALLGRG